MFTPYNTTMMNERGTNGEPAWGLNRDIYSTSEYQKIFDIRLSRTRFVRGNLLLKLNEVRLFDDIFFPGFAETSTSKFLSKVSYEERYDFLQYKEGEPMFESTIELSTMKVIHERQQTSILVLGGICVSVSILLFFVFDYVFKMVVSTQGSMAHQQLLWGLY